jgi:hypothetical protein
VADIETVTARVNAARAAYSLPPIVELPNGERKNPCFCPLGRAFRRDTDDSFFMAVGTKHVRLATSDAKAREIVRQIETAWGIKESKLAREGEQFYVIPLPPELTQFVEEFDAGKLPEFEGKIEKAEKVRFNELAKRLWDVTSRRMRQFRRPTRGDGPRPLG